MQSAGYEANAFATTDEFLDEIPEDCRGCVLLDTTALHIELQRRLMGRKSHIAVIAMSARDDDEIRRAAKRLGARFFFSKPVDDQALLDAIVWATS